MQLPHGHVMDNQSSTKPPLPPHLTCALEVLRLAFTLVPLKKPRHAAAKRLVHPLRVFVPLLGLLLRRCSDFTREGYQFSKTFFGHIL